MPSIYNQTDTAATDGPSTACSGRTGAVNMGTSQIAVGGTAGVAAHLVTIPTTGIRIAYGFETGVNDPNLTSWPAGYYIVNLDVTVGNSNLTWIETFVCRLDNAGERLQPMLQFVGWSGDPQIPTRLGAEDVIQVKRDDAAGEV
jgi:hypothetical protein